MKATYVHEPCGEGFGLVRVALPSVTVVCPVCTCEMDEADALELIEHVAERMTASYS